MKITPMRRGTTGGRLTQLWRSAGHKVTELDRNRGGASDADVILLAVPNQAVTAALAIATGLGGKILLDATNRPSGEAPPSGYPSIAQYVKPTTNGPEGVQPHYANLFEQAAAASTRPGNI